MMKVKKMNAKVKGMKRSMSLKKNLKQKHQSLSAKRVKTVTSQAFKVSHATVLREGGRHKAPLSYPCQKEGNEEHSVPKALAIIKAGKKQSQHFTWQIKGYSSRKTKEMVSSTRLFHIHNHTPHGSTSPKGNKLACSGVEYRVHLKSATHYIALADDLRT